MVDWDYQMHTSFTDGKNSVDEMAERAAAIGLREIAITEHVREKLDYDYQKLAAEIDQAAEKYKIKIWKGVEAKILPNGKLDMPESLGLKIDLILGSVHSWPKEITIETAYRQLTASACQIIAHPNYLSDDLIKEAINFDKPIEINYRYQLPTDQLKLIGKYPKLKVSFGSDSHSVETLDKARQYFDFVAKNFIIPSQIWKKTG
jgi:histidinol phosphatase-like PHP family hydrolase